MCFSKLIGSGTGVTPFRAFLEQLAAEQTTGGILLFFIFVFDFLKQIFSVFEFFLI